MRLAWREIKRAKVRFAILTGAVALLALLILFLGTITSSLVTDFIGALRNQSADVLVYGAQARRNVEGSVVLPAQAAAVAEVAGVAESAPIGEGTFTVEADARLTDAVLWGYELGGPGAPTTLVEGRLPRADDEAVANRGDRAEGFDIGDRVAIVPDGPDIEVVGLGTDLRYSVTPSLFVSYRTYVAAVRAANPDARDVVPTLVGVEPEPGVDPEDVATRISDTVDGVEALDRGTAVDESPGVASVRQSLNLVLALAYTVVVVVTGFFFLILTVQKSEALTLLRAIGATRARLTRSLLAQVLLVVGSGIATAVIALALVARTTGGDVDVEIDPGSVLATAIVLLGCSEIAALVAVRRVLRLDPVSAATGTGPGGAV